MEIYIIENLINGKIYIGKTTKAIKSRFATHVKNAMIDKRKSRLYSAIRKYGPLNFKIASLYKLTDAERSESMLGLMEIHFINKMDSMNPSVGYNMTRGGDGGKNKAGMIASSLLRKGKSFEDLYGEEKAKEIKFKISQGIKAFWSDKDRVMPYSVRKKISLSHKRKWKADKEFRKSRLEQIHTMPRRKRGEFNHSEKTKKKLSLARKGKSYEALFGDEKADNMKSSLSIKWTRDGNPNYVQINVDKQILMWEYIRDNVEETMEDISKEMDISPYLIRKLIRKAGIANWQEFKRRTDIQDCLEKIIKELKDG